MGEGALSGVRVLDLGTWISAPYCAKMLADYGAEVIKVEMPGAGDPARRGGPFPDDIPHPEKSGLFLHCNTNKLGITLDYSQPTGRRMLLELAREADIVVENFAPQTLDGWGLGYETLRAANPALVLVSITPFGQTGPYAHFKGGELIEFAFSTRMAVHGEPGREPLRYGPDVGQFQAGITGAAAAMGALWGALEQGEGTHVDVSSVEAMMGNVDSRIVMYLYDGQISERGGGLGGYPNGAYACADGFMLFASSGDRFFRRMCRAIGRPDLLDDPRWADPAARPLHQDEFEAILLPWLIERTRREVFETCQSHGVMCAPILAIDEVFSDQQNLARGFFAEADHPIAGRLTYAGAPIQLTEGGWQMGRPAPTLGQHNVEVYVDRLGLGKRELTVLNALGVI